MAFQPAFEELINIERPLRPDPSGIGEIAVDLLDDAFAFGFEIQAELLVEFLGELLGIHLVVLVVATLLAGIAVAVIRLWLDRLSGLWLPAVALSDTADLALVVLEGGKVDDLDRDANLVGPRAAEIAVADELLEIFTP